MQRSFGGATLKDQLESVWRQTGVKPKELDDLPLMPKSMKHIWEVFLLLDGLRSTDFGSPNPIPMSEIHAYSMLAGIDFESWELELLLVFDRLKLNQVRKDMQEEQKKANKK